MKKRKTGLPASVVAKSIEGSTLCFRCGVPKSAHDRNPRREPGTCGKFIAPLGYRDT